MVYNLAMVYNSVVFQFRNRVQFSIFAAFRLIFVLEKQVSNFSITRIILFEYEMNDCRENICDVEDAPRPVGRREEHTTL